MDLQAGTKLGPYEVVSPIAVGGMGEVYRAYDTRLGRSVAIKVLSTRLSSDPALRKRFQREARAISLLNHPNICSLYDVGETGDSAYLVMEYLDGETLAQRLSRGAMPVAEALRYAIDIAAALDRAHRAGVVHRDLKPGNVMLTSSGAKLLDFGLARLTAEAEPSAGPLTADDALVGTMNYMSPEQLSGSAVDTRSDIFSFGVMLYEMVTGARPFAGDNRASVIGAILFASPEPAIEKNASLPAAVDRLISACLQKDRDERVQSARDLRRELEWIRDGSASNGPHPARNRFDRLRRLWPLAAAVLLGIAAVASALALWPRAQPQRRMMFDVVSNVPGEQIDWPVISPDGTRLAFISTSREGRRVLWIRDLRSGTNTRIENSDGVLQPFWSPEGARVGFFAVDKLQILSIGDLHPQAVAIATAPRGASWGRDGTILYTPHVSSEVWSTSAVAGAPSRVTHLDPAQKDVSHRWPEFLPDGRHFVFVVQSRILQRSGLYIGELESAAIRKIATVQSRVVVTPEGWILFVRDRRLQRQKLDLARLQMVGDPEVVAEGISADLKVTGASRVSVSREGSLVWLSPPDERTEVGWTDRSGAWVRTLLPADYYVNPALSPDGTRLAISRIDEESGRNSIWICDSSSGRLTPFVDDDANNDGPVWSDDGKNIYFTSDRRGAYEVFERPVEGVASFHLVVPSRNYAQPIGSSVRGTVFHVSGSGTNAAGEFLLNPAGTSDLRPIPGFTMGALAVSRDGKWILGINTRSESTTHDIVIESLVDPSKTLKLASDGGAQPLWRPDGREFYFARRDAMLMATPFNEGQVGTPHPLFPLDVRDLYYANRDYDVSPDGQRFLVSRRVSSTATVAHIVLNWLSER